MRAGLLQIRDAVPSDADAYVNYWHYSGEEVKNLLGIDRAKLGAPENSRVRFFDMMRVPGLYQRNVIFTITLNDEVVGYTNINRHGPAHNYVHLHTYRSSMRLALRAGRSSNETGAGGGPAGILIGLIGGYFDYFPIRRLILLTRTANRWINRALDLYMPPAETKYVANPPGLAAPGECHIRYVRREDMSWMRKRAEFLRSSQEIGEAPAPYWTAQAWTSAQPSGLSSSV
jgi:hypothetical protein